MPHQNRVNPFGDIIARPERGMFTGNRGGELHNERYTEEYFKWDRHKRTYEEAYATLPDGAFVLLDRMPHLVWYRMLYLWTPAGYCAPVPIPGRGEATVLTPKSSVGALRMGYRPGVHGTVEGR